MLAHWANVALIFEETPYRPRCCNLPKVYAAPGKIAICPVKEANGWLSIITHDMAPNKKESAGTHVSA